MTNDSGLLRWMLCILNEIDSELDSGLPKWTHFMLREINSGILRVIDSARLWCEGNRHAALISSRCDDSHFT